MTPQSGIFACGAAGATDEALSTQFRDNLQADRRSAENDRRAKSMIGGCYPLGASANHSTGRPRAVA
jgi:hypothetical protein